jgi:hypothetical protein
MRVREELAMLGCDATREEATRRARGERDRERGLTWIDGTS